MLRPFATTLSVLALITPCSGAQDPARDADPAPANHAHGDHSGSCASDARADAFTMPLTKASTRGALTLRAAEPSLPKKGLNRWRVVLTDEQGAPIDGATLEAVPTMPDHKHGSPTIPRAKSEGAGVYVIEDLDFIMPGYWEIAITAKTASREERAVLRVCVEG